MADIDNGSLELEEVQDTNKKHVIIYDPVNNDSIIAACIAKKYYDNKKDADDVELVKVDNIENYSNKTKSDIIICGATIASNYIKQWYSEFSTNVIAFDCNVSNISCYRNVSPYIRGYRSEDRGISLLAYKFFFDNVDVDYVNSKSAESLEDFTILPDLVYISTYNSYTTSDFNCEDISFTKCYEYNKGFIEKYAFDIDSIYEYISLTLNDFSKSKASEFITSGNSSLIEDKASIILQVNSYKDTSWIVNDNRKTLMLLTHIVLTDDILSQISSLVPSVSTIVTFTRNVSKTWTLRLYKLDIKNNGVNITEEDKEQVEQYESYVKAKNSYTIKLKKGTLTDEDITAYQAAQVALTDEYITESQKLQEIIELNEFSCKDYLNTMISSTGDTNYAFTEISEKQFIAILKSKAF